MANKYTKEQLWKLYEKLPDVLKEAVFAEDTANSIREICVRNEITDERAGKIAEYVGHVLLGAIMPNELEETLEKEVGLEKEQAKKVAQEINRFVFFPVKGNIEALHKIEVEKPSAQATEVKPSGEKPTPEKPKGPDVYKEPVE